MNVESLLAAGEVLTALCAEFLNAKEEKEKCARAAGHLAIAHDYIAELATHLINGLEPHEALLATARGKLKTG
jgi:hypothetical protein